MAWAKWKKYKLQRNNPRICTQFVHQCDEINNLCDFEAYRKHFLLQTQLSLLLWLAIYYFGSQSVLSAMAAGCLGTAISMQLTRIILMHCHLNAFNTECCFKYQLLQKTSCFHCCTDLCRFPWQQKFTPTPDVAGLRLLGWFFLTIYQNHQQTVAATHEMNISMTKKISAGKCWASISLSHLIG